MADRSSNGEYKYQREDSSESKPRIPLEKEREEKDHQADKAGEYVRELLQEKLELDGSKWPNAHRLIDQEIQKTQAIGKPLRDPKYVDIYREKPIRVAVKVLVPVREHPKQFNFVGKLLGPKGNSMKRLQEETMCKMAVLGRGSMKDRQKEEECRQSLDPKYAHLSDDLHVEIAALAPPAEAHARIAFALAEVRKYLIPDNNDNIRQEQMREMELTMADDPSAGEERRPSARGGGILRPSSRPTVPRSSRAAILPPPSSRGPITRPVPAKTKVFSILDRARVAMDQSYGYEAPTPPPSSRVASHHDYDYHPSSSSSSRYADRHYTSSSADDLYPSSRYTTYEYEDDAVPHSSHDYYESSEYPEESSSRAWKSYKTTTTSSSSSRYRTAPYSRPSK
ncbi:KH domain-containing, RNA-binding, signal transduction-associated protein 2-like isoform X3 [Neodiprion pinetum]|uniref:KH domain-containing, RNA-binding, signal transduction-associated protein 2 isoform X3 n=1 Tax=Neodiprion lecontei TaxID=441921 RepID=A0ABM3FSK8_NEOLC|nr:KH domain-containing, RNA-binding, signal transduction-associated protein 2-like isoform X3 [Neodiprion fabricii]XP_046472113.1 KH domain-containing, RNA-binding, signal transduction-associated protein 2-like isoform X3 [Neodiprion pinetum]XP_046590996.1 KH domain-containing, RNA-binding, signal transduction-associated protein 2 isoform X3 [Neodiprion lecontei]XP_046611984.1 KH domain-containing, RNA-binding, signal transduction-associated protein 2-like isoform X3 [Neodiprion virginianus]XP